MNKFFQTLPAKLKVFLQVLQVLLGAFVATVLYLLTTPLGKYLKEDYLVNVAIVFAVGFPVVYTGVEMLKGVPGTSPKEAKNAIDS